MENFKIINTWTTKENKKSQTRKDTKNVKNCLKISVWITNLEYLVKLKMHIPTVQQLYCQE